MGLQMNQQSPTPRFTIQLRRALPSTAHAQCKHPSPVRSVFLSSAWNTAPHLGVRKCLILSAHSYLRRCQAVGNLV
jgi:hypothetical protein